MSPVLRRLAVQSYIRRLGLSSRPIVIGPWRSELGFEALYWLPFLRWAQAYGNVNPARFVTLTRGGAGTFYGAPGVDLYQLRSVSAVRQENLYDAQATKVQKQMRVTRWDRAVASEAADYLHGRGTQYHLLHPSWMYWALEPFWEEHAGMRYLLSLCDFTPIPKMPLPAGVPLPDKFVAMKFYARHTFPVGPDTQSFIMETAKTIAAQTHIVLLSSGVQADEHQDVRIEGPNIVNLPAVAAEQNVALQAAVLSKASAFVGVYGGTAQLALRMGIPSVSFYKHFNGTAHAHLTLSEWLGKQTKTPFLSGSLQDAHLWSQVVGRVMTQPPGVGAANVANQETAA